jgi:hypothetical protein
MVLECGQVWGIGSNDYIQLGSTAPVELSFVKISDGVGSVYVGPYYTAVTLLNKNSPPIGWGDNSWDSVNDGHVNGEPFAKWPDNITQIHGILFCSGVSCDGRIWKALGREASEPVLLNYPSHLSKSIAGKNVFITGSYNNL